MISRRNIFLLGVSMLPIAACSLTPAQIASISSEVVTNVQAIGSGLKSILPQVAAVVGIPATTVTTVTNLIGEISSVAAGISAVTTQPAATTVVGQIENDLNAVISALAAVPFLPLPITLALQAASVLLPAAETALGMLVPLSVKARADAVDMTKAGALAYLQSLK